MNSGNTHPSPEVKLRGRAVSIVSNFTIKIFEYFEANRNRPSTLDFTKKIEWMFLGINPLR
jgi:hypothetical protein